MFSVSKNIFESLSGSVCIWDSLKTLFESTWSTMHSGEVISSIRNSMIFDELELLVSAFLIKFKVNKKYNYILNKTKYITLTVFLVWYLRLLPLPLLYLLFVAFLDISSASFFGLK